MPVHIDELVSDITVIDGELPLSPSQIDKLVRLVIGRIDEQKRASVQRREATQVRPDSIKPAGSHGCGCD